MNDDQKDKIIELRKIGIGYDDNHNLKIKVGNSVGFFAFNDY